jgi:hypothetical protein
MRTHARRQARRQAAAGATRSTHHRPGPLPPKPARQCPASRAEPCRICCSTGSTTEAKSASGSVSQAAGSQRRSLPRMLCGRTAVSASQCAAWPLAGGPRRLRGPPARRPGSCRRRSRASCCCWAAASSLPATTTLSGRAAARCSHRRSMLPPLAWLSRLRTRCCLHLRLHATLHAPAVLRSSSLLLARQDTTSCRNSKLPRGLPAMCTPQVTLTEPVPAV